MDIPSIWKNEGALSTIYLSLSFFSESCLLLFIVPSSNKQVVTDGSYKYFYAFLLYF